MARYREIADDLRQKIRSGEFPVGLQLPSISRMQEHYNVPGLNTVRQAQQILVDEGYLETRQGVGAFVLSADPAPRQLDVLVELRAARSALNRVIAALEQPQTS